MQHCIAIDDVCAWPNLTRLPDGTIVSTIFNQPCHGSWEGDAECWASADGGKTWQRRGTPAQHAPGTNRMNLAAGLANNSDLVVLCSGWSNRPKAGEPPIAFSDSAILKAWICRSSDGGSTWRVDRESFPGAVDERATQLIPFGDILPGADGLLGVSCYCGHKSGPHAGQDSAWFLTSQDDGKTWGSPVPISATNHNETTPLHLGDGRWIVASRTQSEGRLDQFSSCDNGKTWTFDQPLSLPSQHPAHLLRLQDGRVLLTYGVRCRKPYGVDARVSANEGQIWSAPARVAAYDEMDSGYPSAAQNADGSLVTAYYAAKEPACDRYHMGVALWQPEELFP